MVVPRINPGAFSAACLPGYAHRVAAVSVGSPGHRRAEEAVQAQCLSEHGPSGASVRAVTRVVTSTYRRKRPPRKRKAPAPAGPAVVGKVKAAALPTGGKNKPAAANHDRKPAPVSDNGCGRRSSPRDQPQAGEAPAHRAAAEPDDDPEATARVRAFLAPHDPPSWMMVCRRHGPFRRAMSCRPGAARASTPSGSTSPPWSPAARDSVGVILLQI